MVRRTVCGLTAALMLMLSPGVQADEIADLVAAAVKAAGGADKLPKVLHWKEVYFIGAAPDAKGTPRDAWLAFPDAWYQNRVNIAAGNADRTDKAWLAWVWSLGALTDPGTKLSALPDSRLKDRLIKGLRVSRENRKDIDIYFDADDHKLARIDWRAYQIDFSDWKEANGFKYPAEAFVRRKDGSLHLRTVFQSLEVVPELPADLKK